MVYQIYYKRIIALLMIVLIFIGGLLWHKEQTTNKEIPKRANFVKNNFERSKIYGEGIYLCGKKSFH